MVRQRRTKGASQTVLHDPGDLRCHECWTCTGLHGPMQWVRVVWMWHVMTHNMTCVLLFSAMLPHFFCFGKKCAKRRTPSSARTRTLLISIMGNGWNQRVSVQTPWIAVPHYIFDFSSKDTEFADDATAQSQCVHWKRERRARTNLGQS